MFPFSFSWFSGPVCEEIKKYPVLYKKEMKGYGEKDVASYGWNARAKDQEFIENGQSNFILFSMFYLR